MHKVTLTTPIWFTRPLSVDEQNELIDKLYSLFERSIAPGGYLDLQDVDAVDFDVELSIEE